MARSARCATAATEGDGPAWMNWDVEVSGVVKPSSWCCIAAGCGCETSAGELVDGSLLSATPEAHTSHVDHVAQMLKCTDASRSLKHSQAYSASLSFSSHDVHDTLPLPHLFRP